MSITKLFLILIRAFVADSQIEEELRPLLTTEVLEKLFHIAKAHDVVQIVSEILFRSNLLPEGDPITKKYQAYQIDALRRYAFIEREQKKIFALFEEKGIAFIPLKGAVIRQYYPDPYMRTSGDIDILVREGDLREAIAVLASDLNYRSGSEIRFHDVLLLSEGGFRLELHYNLKEKRENLDKVLIKVWDHSVNAENQKYHKLEKPEFFIFHHIAHMVNHFLRGGCGIRTFIDLYYIKEHMDYDEATLYSLLNEGGIGAFYRAVMTCVEAWFGSAPTTEIVDLIEAFVLKGGVYGTRKNRVRIEQSKRGGKGKYFFSRIFVPYDTLKCKYPILQKHKILLPIMWFVRMISFVSPQKRKRAQKELEIYKGISGTAERATERMLELLEI